MSKLAWAMVTVFVITFIWDLYITYTIIHACLLDKGENGCIGVSIFHYFILLLPILLLVALGLFYLSAHSQDVNFQEVLASLVLYLILASGALFLPMAISYKVGEAYLHNQRFFIFDFRHPQSKQ